MKPRAADLAVAIASAALFLACVAGLALDLRAGDSGGGERVGSLVLKKRVAQRRPAGRAVWAGISVNDPLRSGDAIRTDAGSGAVVLLDDGTELTLAENSLVLLEFDPRGATLEFVSGAVSARRDVAGDATLRVKTAGLDLELGSGTLEIAGKDGAVEAFAPSGSATARVAGTEVELSGSAGISADAGGSRAVSYGIVQTAPASGAVVLVPGEGLGLPVDLAWSGGVGPWLVEFSRTRDLIDAVALRASGASSAFALEPGAWHWRVSDATGATSPVSRFSVFPSTAPAQLAPRPAEAFAPGESVALAWAPVEGASAYECELARPGLSDAAPEIVRTAGEGYAFPAKEPGEYAWRVRSVFGYGGAGSGEWSEPREFRVTSTALPPPAAVAPLPSEATASSGSLLAPADGAWFEAGTELTLARGGGGTGRLSVWRAPNPDAPIAEFPEAIASARFVPPGPGEYVWGFSSGDGTGESRRFTVLAPLSAPAPVTPEPGAALDLPESRSLVLSWRAVDGATSYRVTIRTAAEGGSALERTVSATDLEIRGTSLGPGEYLWRVVAEGEDPDGNPRFGPPATATFSVSRFGPLAAPSPLRPAAGAALDLSRASSLDFAWTAVAGANRYELELRDARGRLVVRRETALASWSFLDLARLDKGRYSVSVAASYVASDGVGERTGPPATWTFVLSAEDPESAPVIVSPKEIYVLGD
ncbi:MAG: FecR domain-containing protein [Spirochaetia bacterium]|nr:FecR domain-containing protein [Spirochaetia bacterium]